MKLRFPKLFIFFCLISLGMGQVAAQADAQSAGQGLEGLLQGNSGSQSSVKGTVERTHEVRQVTPGTYDEFLALEKECRSNNASACLKSGNIMMAERPPKEIYDLSSNNRAIKALQLYERAIDMGNLQAMEAAYDLYYDPDPVSRLLNPYADTNRAKELLEIMVSKNYPGGLARKAKDFLENLEYLLSVEKKKDGCAMVKNLTNQPNMSDATKKIVENLNSSLICSVVNK